MSGASRELRRKNYSSCDKEEEIKIRHVLRLNFISINNKSSDRLMFLTHVDEATSNSLCFLLKSN